MDTVLQASESALLFITEAVVNLFAILDKFYDHSYQMSVRNKPQKLAGQVTMPHGVIGCREVQKESTSLLFSREIVLDFVGCQGDLIYSRSCAWKPACSCGSRGSMTSSMWM